MKNSVKRTLSLILAIVLAAGAFCVSKPVRAQGGRRIYGQSGKGS